MVEFSFDTTSGLLVDAGIKSRASLQELLFAAIIREEKLYPLLMKSQVAWTDPGSAQTISVASLFSLYGHTLVEEHLFY